MTLLIEQRCVAENMCGKDRVTWIAYTHTRDREISFKGFDYRNTTMLHVIRENIILKYSLSLRSLLCWCKKRYEHLRKKLEGGGKGEKSNLVISSFRKWRNVSIRFWIDRSDIRFIRKRDDNFFFCINSDDKEIEN